MRILSLALSAVLLAGCQANPGPPPVEEAPPVTETVTETTTAPTTAEAPATARTNINIGVDALRNGFNPHLIADDSALVRDLAALVLPSAFTAGQLNTDLLESVEQPTPTTIRYTIAPEAQWSDGTPITGSDFEYLRRSIVATPGSFNRAAYGEISSIRTTGGGRTVEVALKSPLSDWRQLFSNLLPAHLVENFATSLYSAIPAAGGRYMVRDIDRQRGIVTLARNDRFWGEDPAHVELLTFHNAASASRAGELLRTRQSSFINVRPTETMVDTLTLLPGTEVRVSDTDRTLELVLNAENLDPAQRARLLSLVDVPLAARLAAGRSATLSVAPTLNYTGVGVEKPGLPALRLAVDPTDDASVSAGRAIVDMLARAGVTATTVPTDLAEVWTGNFDGVLTWTRDVTDSLTLADRYTCGSNLARWCAPETTGYVESVLSGETAFDPDWDRRQNQASALRLPILHETRVEARTGTVIGADPGSWPGGIASASQWRKNDPEQ